jgi:hypothetical protein
MTKKILFIIIVLVSIFFISCSAEDSIDSSGESEIEENFLENLEEEVDELEKLVEDSELGNIDSETQNCIDEAIAGIAAFDEFMTACEENGKEYNTCLDEQPEEIRERTILFDCS